MGRRRTTYPVKLEKLSDLDDGNGRGQVGLVGEDKDGAVRELVLGEEGEKLCFGLIEALDGKGGEWEKRRGGVRGEEAARKAVIRKGREGRGGREGKEE